MNIEIKLAQRISEVIYEKDILSLDINEFESYIKSIVKYHAKDVNYDFIDVLLLLDDNNNSTLEHIIREDCHKLFIDLLHKYHDTFMSLDPTKWECLLFHDSNNCHEIFKNFYNDEYFSKIVNPNYKNVTRYSDEHFERLYLNGDLDNAFKSEYLPEMYYNSTLLRLHTLNFFNTDKEGFKKFMFSNFSEYLEADLATYSKNLLKYSDLICKLSPKANSISSITKNVTLNLPNSEEIRLLNKKWGVQKTSEVLSDFINFQKEYLSQPGIVSRYKFNFDDKELFNNIKEGIEFVNCGSSLCFGLKNNMELVSYLIIKGVITHENLLDNINNQELYRDAHHSFLDASLERNSDSLTNKKLKI